MVLWALLRRTAVGQGMTAVGLNESGAIFAGMRTRWLKVLAFALSGLLAGVAGIMIIAQAGAASSFGLGSDLLLPGIAAAIVGGTAITGGVTNPINVIFGALTMTLIPIGAATVGVPPQAQSLVYGLVIIIAVALTISRRATRNREVAIPRPPTCARPDRQVSTKGTTMTVLDSLQPREVLSFFETLASIPRGRATRSRWPTGWSTSPRSAASRRPGRPALRPGEEARDARSGGRAAADPARAPRHGVREGGGRHHRLRDRADPPGGRR